MLKLKKTRSQVRTKCWHCGELITDKHKCLQIRAASPHKDPWHFVMHLHLSCAVLVAEEIEMVVEGKK